jgi:hypothetical protein
MVYGSSGQWIADLNAMTCRNYVWNITVAFEKQGEAIIGKISDMPNNLNRKWILTKNGYQILKKIIRDAEEVFFMAYFENELEKCGIPKNNLRERKRLILRYAEMEYRKAV